MNIRARLIVVRDIQQQNPMEAIVSKSLPSAVFLTSQLPSLILVENEDQMGEDFVSRNETSRTYS